MKKIKKLSYRQLTQQVRGYQMDEQNWRAMHEMDQREIQGLKKALQTRLDMSMLQERTKLAGSVGQMVDAVSHAIRFVVGIEVL